MFDKRLIKMCPDSIKYIAGNVVLQWLELAANAVMIILIALTVQQIYDRSVTLYAFLTRLLILFVTVFVRRFTARGAVKMSYMASRTVKRVMREQIYSKLLRLGITYREHATTAELVQESVEGVEQLESCFGQYLPQLFYAFIAPVTLFFLFSFIGSMRVAAVLLICVPLIPAAIITVQKIAKKLLAKYWAQYTKLGSTFLENLQGMTTLKTYQADGYKSEQMKNESECFRTVTMKVLTMQLNSIIIMDFFAYGGAALGIILACREYMEAKLDMAGALSIILLSVEFFLPMRRLGSFFHVAMNGMAASENIFRFLNESEPERRTLALPDSPGGIRLDEVYYSYTPDREVLHGVSVYIPDGGFTGIVGESGSGKSTVASLIMGRNTAKKGKVMIAGMDTRMLSEESLLKNITYVGLGSVFFKGTVRDNLLLADPDATDEKLMSVLGECSIADFLLTENGLDTFLLENAGNLSGGQKQRLALARALLHDSPIYIFDEATSNIDIESEEALLREIKKLSETKTVIMITHRLENIREADMIYCMEGGRVAGRGSHEELIATCETYKSLWKTQRELEKFGNGGAEDEKTK